MKIEKDEGEDEGQEISDVTLVFLLTKNLGHRSYRASPMSRQ